MCNTGRLYVSRVTTDAAKLNWSAITELTTYTIKFADFDFDPEKQYNDVVTISECSSTYYDMTDLETDTEYFFYVKADCDSYWSKVAKFRTECDILSIPYSESFHEFDLTLEELPSCWRYQNVMSGWVTKNCIPTLISNSNCSEAPYALKLASFLDNDITGDYNAIETALYLPKFNKELDKLYIKFSAYALEKESFVKVGSVTEVYDQSTFNVIAEIELSQNCQEYVVSFDASTTNDGYITLLLEDQTLTMYISDILVDTFEYCQPVTLLYDTDLTESSVSIHWSPMSQQDSLWQLMITDVEIINVNQFDTLTSLLVDTIIQGVNIDLLNLDANTSYYYTIRAVCGENNYGYFYPYVRSFRTPCVDLQIPYVEVFDNLMLETALPACWSSYKGTFDQVISTGEFTSESNSWLQRDTFGLVGTHMVVPITWNNFEWLISAPVEIDTTTIVSFDLARTNQGGGSAPSSRRPMNDDRMIFVVSTDGGETWDIENQIVWNDNAYMPGSHSFAAIPPTGQNYIVDLSRYMNQTIRVAFYVESTMGDYSLDFHLGNVKFVNLPSKVINDLSCENRDYNDNGFAIPANELEFSGHYMYRRTFVNENGLDSMIVLDLTVMPNVKNTINVMICEGETYNLNGFNESLSGVYYNYLPSSLGCDSILELYLVVMSDTIFESKVTICESELPYAWNNNLYTISGRYLDTLSSSLGCDSIVSLELNVLETNHTTVAQTIFSNDLPYEYNGYIFDENTPLGITTYIFRGLDMNGCDSTHTINLNVMDTTTNGQFDITENFFELYPNPINRYGEVTLNANFTETELSNGLTVEVFNAVGECVNTIRPTALPIRIDGFDASGVYIVRVTTSENRIEYGKVVVR